MIRRLRRGAAGGLAAGAAGMLAEAAWSRGERLLLGQEPVFGTTPMAHRLISRVLGAPPSEAAARRVGVAMRCAYGPSWGLLLHWVWVRGHPSPAAAIVALAGTIWGFELVALPRIGATPALRSWPLGEVLLDASNAVVFAAVAVAVLDGLGLEARA